jgi:phytoene dehydrogenase-like protein
MGGYDVIVVGAGNGGLTASAALAQKGLNVLLLERHNLPGGSATSFCRGRFEFEVALHQLSGLGTPQNPGPLRGLLGSLGVLEDLSFVEMSDLYRVQTLDGFDVTLRADRHQVVTELQDRFPGEKGAIEAFFQLVYDFAEQMVQAIILRDPEPSREKYPVLYRYSLLPSKDVLDEYFQDPVLKAVLSAYWGYLGLPPSRLAFTYLAMLFFTYIEFKPFHLNGGSQALSNAIASRFLAQGGTVRYHCGVKKILVEGGAVRGVLTDDGEEIPARFVISNVSPVITYLQLIGDDQVPEKALTEMRGRSLGPSAFTLYMGFDCEHGELDITESTNFILPHTEIGDRAYNQMREVEMGSEFMLLSCYDVADPDFSPPGTSQVSLVTLKFGEPWLRVPSTEYFRTKYRCAEAMLRTTERVYPNLRAHIEEMEVATPLTHMRYLGHPAGSIYGFEQHTKDALFFQPGRRSPIEGLFFASGWTGDPGFQPTLEAGKAAARSILKEMDA